MVEEPCSVTNVEVSYLQVLQLKSCIVRNVNLNKKQNEKHTRITNR
jgi:hypothetical protein